VASVPTKFPWITVPLELFTEMPAVKPVLAETTLPAPGAVPPIVVGLPSSRMPVALPMATAPVASVPM
jgi:hypothetical protein